MAQRRVLKILLSSPSDIPVARAEAAKQARNLNNDPEIAKNFLLEVQLWEESAPSRVGKPPQEIINAYTGRARDADIVICVFGRRFGTEGIVAGRRYASGTYYEFTDAERAQRRNRAGKPIILLYRLLKDPPLEEGQEDKEQAANVEALFQEFKRWGQGVYHGLPREYREVEKFGAELANHLKSVILREFLPPAGSSWLSSLKERLGFGVDPETGRKRMLHKVRDIWIKGVLNDITARIAAPFETRVRIGEDAGQNTMLSSALAGDELRTLFDDAGHRLIIFGKQGAGKTFKLLELTKALLDRADENPSLPVPVVFNLSSWAGHRGTMADWLISQLVSSRYGVPYKLAKMWVDDEKLTLCLDGLEEITVSGVESGSDKNAEARKLLDDRRRECLQALNQYVDGTEIQFALCCRDDQYAALGANLDAMLGSLAKITIAELSDDQVRTYLESSKDELKSLGEAMDRDSTLREMARTPFLLTAMAIAYCEDQAASTSDILAGGKGGIAARLTHLFGKYLHVQYGNNKTPRVERYSLAQVRHYLGELAQKMESDSFFVEHLKPHWLPPDRRWQHIALVSLFLFIFVTAIVAVPSGVAIGYEWTSYSQSLSEGFRHGVAGALAIIVGCGGLVAGGYAITKNWGFGIACGLGLGVARGIIIGISPNEGGWPEGLRAAFITSVVSSLVLVPVMKLRRHARDEIQPLESHKWDTRKALLGIVAASFIGLVFWRAFGPARGLGFGLGLMPILALAFGDLGTSFQVKTYPNQGIWESAYAALRIAVIGALTGMICFGTSYWLSFGLQESWEYGRRQGIVNAILGLTLAIASLVFGAVPLMQHLSLRCLLIIHRQTPRNLVAFLNAATDLHLLRQVGGGYMFQHSYLREYFHRLRRQTRKRDVKSLTAEA